MNLVRYKLISSKIPIIEENKIINDCGVGGVKLVYQVKTYPLKSLVLFNKVVRIPLLLKGKKETKVFLKPYKKNLDKREIKLPSNFWGKKKHPLTRLWIELEKDYDNIIDSKPKVKKKLKETLVFRNLQEQKNQFTLICRSD